MRGTRLFSIFIGLVLARFSWSPELAGKKSRPLLVTYATLGADPVVLGPEFVPVADEKDYSCITRSIWLHDGPLRLSRCWRAHC